MSVACYAQTDSVTIAQADSFAKQTNCVMKFGCLSYEAALKAMPDYAVAQKSLDELKAKYDAEVKRVEDEFNKKYSEKIIENSLIKNNGNSCIYAIFVAFLLHSITG